MNTFNLNLKKINSVVEAFLRLPVEQQILVLKSEESKKFDYQTLIGFYESDDYRVRYFTRERALEIPSEKLNYVVLVELYGLSGFNIPRIYLIRELAIKIPSEKLDRAVLMGYQRSVNANKSQFAKELLLRIPSEKSDTLSTDARNFIKKHLR